MPAAFLVGVRAVNALTMRRCSPSHHVVFELAVRSRGLFFSRTPDGTWWALRLRTTLQHQLSDRLG